MHNFADKNALRNFGKGTGVFRTLSNIWDNVIKNEPKQTISLKMLLKTFFHKFYLVHS